MRERLQKLLDRLPPGRAGLAIKIAFGLVAAAWWTSAPGADEQIDFKANQDPEKRGSYMRHYAFKGRGRKEYLRQDVKADADELVPTRAFARSAPALPAATAA